MPTNQQIEAIEMEAWQNMFDIAPESFRKEMNLYYRKTGGGICFVFPKYPVVHFNMAMSFGYAEPITETLLEEIKAIYEKEQQPVYMIQYCEHQQPANAPQIFDSCGFKVAGGWERITWKPEKAEPIVSTRNIRLEEVTGETVAAWEQFILDLYHYPAKDWLKAFISKGWHNFLAYENEKIVACRSIYVGENNLAWSGVEAPVPIVMTNDLEPDRFIWKHIQQYCFDTGVELLVADIEKPSPERNTPIYHFYAQLGFKVEYLRSLYRKKQA